MNEKEEKNRDIDMVVHAGLTAVLLIVVAMAAMSFLHNFVQLYGTSYSTLEGLETLKTTVTDPVARDAGEAKVIATYAAMLTPLAIGIFVSFAAMIWLAWVAARTFAEFVRVYRREPSNAALREYIVELYEKDQKKNKK